MQATELHDRLVELVGPVVDAVGLDLETVTVTMAGRRRLVRVVVDRDGGVTSDELAEVSKRVSTQLDDADAVRQGAYTLEVSTPGVDRPLSQPRHWRRARGRLVKTALVGTGDEVRGRVVTADESGVVLEHEGEQHRYSYDDLGPGRIEVEFRRPDVAAAGTEGDTEEDLR